MLPGCFQPLFLVISIDNRITAADLFFNYRKWPDSGKDPAEEHVKEYADHSKKIKAEKHKLETLIRDPVIVSRKQLLKNVTVSGYPNTVS